MRRVWAALSDDRGSLTPATIFLMIGLLAFGGLGFDLWSLISERRVLQELCDASARAGANGIDIPYFDVTGGVRLDPALAETLAVQNLNGQDPEATRAMTSASLGATTEQVRCVLQGRVEFLFLRLTSIDFVDLEVESVAEPRVGSGAASEVDGES